MELTIVAHPNSKNPRIQKDLLGNLHVYVKSPPLNGNANTDIMLALAKFFKIKNNQVELTSGYKSKIKTFSINLEQEKQPRKN